MSILPPKPDAPEFYRANKPRGTWTDDEYQQMNRYFAALHNWETLAAASGRSYTWETFANISDKAHEELVRWLEAHDAPAAVVILARHIENAAIIRFSLWEKWNRMDDYRAAQVGGMLPELRAALKWIKQDRKQQGHKFTAGERDDAPSYRSPARDEDIALQAVDVIFSLGGDLWIKAAAIVIETILEQVEARANDPRGYQELLTRLKKTVNR